MTAITKWLGVEGPDERGQFTLCTRQSWTPPTCMVLSADEASALIRALGGTPPGDPGWQPIETAPKDGTALLIFDGRNRFIGYFARRHGGASNCWVARGVGILTRIPSYWMPLPAPPRDPEGR